MSIFQGTTELDELYLGTNEIGEVFQGSDEIWTNACAYDLGTANTFNIKNLFPNEYTTFTANNFFVVSSTRTGTWGRAWYQGGSASSGFSKSYNASTGILSVNYQLNCSDGSTTYNCACRMYLVKKPSKIAYLGWGTGFNVASIYPTKYTSFTSDNIVTLNMPTARASANYEFGVGYSKGYNASTGACSFYGTWYKRDPDASGSVSCGIYCVPKIKSL